MKTVRVYIETTIHGPSVRDGKYAAALVFTKQNGEVKNLFVQGEEAETTYNRSVLLAMIRGIPEISGVMPYYLLHREHVYKKYDPGK